MVAADDQQPEQDGSTGTQVQARPAFKLPNRQTPFSEAFKKFIPQGWAPYSSVLPEPLPASVPAASRRRALAARFPGERLVIPAGRLVTRNNDCDYAFRPYSAFAWLTGLGTDREPNAVLVIEPDHDTLYFKPRAPRTDREFYADPTYGEMWVGQRESLAEMEALTGIHCASIDEFEADLGKDVATIGVRIARDADPSITEAADYLRPTDRHEDDDEFGTVLSTMRMIKDSFEVEQLKEACRDTATGFTAIVADLPDAVCRGRGERWVEGVFGLHARHQGNAVGYDTIAAAGDHANTLHWMRNNGDVREGDLILIDAGVELDSLYTADVTRTLPISGKYTPEQRQVYDAVLEAQNAGMAAARPGALFADVHAAAIAVIARHLEEWGMLPVSAEETLSPEGGQYRRWMVHGTSHHLGLDVHDCAKARNEDYRQGVLKPGMCITVEPGIYIKSTDLLAPPELRGIGVRIEDDILITDDGCEILSSMLPRTADAVEQWMADVWSSGD